MSVADPHVVSLLSLPMRAESGEIMTKGECGFQEFCKRNSEDQKTYSDSDEPKQPTHHAWGVI